MTARKNIRHYLVTLQLRWHVLWQERRGEVLPREWTALALLGSVAAFVIGSRWVGQDFWVNILASLALLGPGLLLTNVIAARWRVKRDWQQQARQVTALSDGLSEWVLNDIYRPVREMLQDSGTEVPEEFKMLGSTANPFARFLELAWNLEHLREASLRSSIERADDGGWVDVSLIRGWRTLDRPLELALARLEVFAAPGVARFTANRIIGMVHEHPMVCREPGQERRELPLAQMSPKARVQYASLCVFAADLCLLVSRLMVEIYRPVLEQMPDSIV